MLRERLLICRSGAYVDILLCFALEQSVIPLYLFGDEADEFSHSVEGHILQLFGNLSFVADIALYYVYAFGEGAVADSAVNEPEIVSLS